MTWLNIPDTNYSVSLAPVPETHIPLTRTQVGSAPVVLAERTWPVIQALRAAGHKVPSLEGDYEYPGPFSPMAHQRQTVEFLLDHERAANLSDPGTGKTAAAVWAADCLMKHHAVRRVLIVAPKSILLPVWGREIFQTVPYRTYAVLSGSAQTKRKVAEDTRIPFLIVNYESLHLLEGHLPDVDLVIADESTKIKDYRAKRTQALIRIADGRRLWLLTGTPAPQAPTDAYTSIRALRNGKFMSFKMFQAATMLQVTSFKWEAKADAPQTVAAALQPAIRFRRQDCFDLPERQIIDLEVEPTEQQAELARAFMKQAWADLNGRKITAVNAGVALSKALQVLTGGVYHPEGDDRVTGASVVDASPMLEQVRTIVEQTDGPVLIFAPYRISAAMMHAHLLDAGLKSALVTGDVGDAERTAIFDAVQARRLNAMVAIPQTVSHGLTLTASDTIIWLAPCFSYETYEQGNARIYRKGQERKTVVYRLTQMPLTQALWKRLDTRATLQDTILRLMEEKG